LYRSLDKDSPEDEYEAGDNKYIFEVQTYYSFKF